MNTSNDLASKDCRVCNRRRIKCGRELPTCRKCEKRGLVCSGYGVILKWDQGVASRGNLKGKSLPVKEVQNVPSILNHVEGHESSEIEVYRSDDARFSKFETTIPPSLVPWHLQNPNERRLLHHYDCVVARNMAWADSSENSWRSIIIPLSLQSPSLLNAILAFAAKHINALSFAASRNASSMIPVSLPNTFQQQAMKLLAREIQDFAAAEPNVASRDRLNALLATMLVLCNVETVWPDSPVWQVHLDAARTVMASHQNSISTTMDKDPTSTFLEQELFIANTFASTTNFLNLNSNDDLRLDSAISKPSSLFVEFLKLLQIVTSLERQASTDPAALASSGVSLSGLRKLFEYARSRTLEMGKAFQVSNADDYLHLSRTVNCFYHAGLIYSYRALLKDPFDGEKQSQISTSTTELFKALGFSKTSKPTFAQDLVWPLFIAGTEATQIDEQDRVVAKLRQAMSETGFSNIQHALEFLKALWERRAGGERLGIQLDWIEFAREWAGHGRTFLVF